MTSFGTCESAGRGFWDKPLYRREEEVYRLMREMKEQGGPRVLFLGLQSLTTAPSPDSEWTMVGEGLNANPVRLDGLVSTCRH